jgi:hypothetical protein
MSSLDNNLAGSKLEVDMQTPQEFVQSVLRERAELDRINQERSMVHFEKFYAGEYVKSLRDLDAECQPETIAGVEVSNTTARVFTVCTVFKQEQRHRYLLRLSGSDWQIYAKEQACVFCHGSGRNGKIDCFLCGGAGWRDYIQNPQNTSSKEPQE